MSYLSYHPADRASAFTDDLNPCLKVRGTDTGPKQRSDTPTAIQGPGRAIKAARGVVAALRCNHLALWAFEATVSL